MVVVWLESSLCHQRTSNPTTRCAPSDHCTMDSSRLFAAAAAAAAAAFDKSIFLVAPPSIHVFDAGASRNGTRPTVAISNRSMVGRPINKTRLVLDVVDTHPATWQPQPEATTALVCTPGWSPPARVLL